METLSATYQHENSSPEPTIDRRYYRNLSFHAHFHANPELAYLAEGELEVMIDGDTTIVS